MNENKEKLIDNLLLKYRNEVLIFNCKENHEDKEKAKESINNIHEQIMQLLDKEE